MNDTLMTEHLMQWRRAQREGDTQAASRHLAEAERLRGRTTTPAASTTTATDKPATFSEAIEQYRAAHNCDYRTAAHAVDAANPRLRARQILGDRPHA